MLITILTSIITMLISTFVGYLLRGLKEYKKKYEEKIEEEKTVKEALKNLIQSSLTNIYYAYAKEKKIPDYVYKNFLNLFKIYKNLDGNDFMEKIVEKMEEWEIIKTDILK